MRLHLVVVAGLVLTGSIAEARPGERRVAYRADERDEEEEEEEEEDDDEAQIETYDGDEEELAYRAIDEDDIELDDAWQDERLDDERLDVIERPRGTRRSRARAKPWHVAIGPYLWASSVDANVSLGDASVSTGVDFMDIQRNARYGATILAEARYRRFGIYADVMYGVVGLDGQREVGPFMVKLAGTASSLMVDGAAGYLVAGDARSAIALEARVGLRYQRTAIAGAVNVAGAEVARPTYVDAAADGLAGARVVVRPHGRLTLAGVADAGVVGASSSTWSAAADAGVRVTRRVLLTLGWRTMTTRRENVSIVMHGPRAAIQLTF